MTEERLALGSYADRQLSKTSGVVVRVSSVMVSARAMHAVKVVFMAFSYFSVVWERYSHAAASSSSGQNDWTSPRYKGNQLFVIAALVSKMAVYATILGFSVTAMAPIASAQGNERTITLEGRCDYRSGAADAGPDTGFALCSSVTIIPDGGNSAIDYLRSLGGSDIRFDGVLSGDTMAIRSIAVRGREAEAASGECTIYRRRDQISTVTCIARSGRITYAANFVRSRINPTR